jgi:hypothetical protein
LALGLGRQTFWLLLVWQAATVAWHAGRTTWILIRGEVPHGVQMTIRPNRHQQ